MYKLGVWIWGIALTAWLIIVLIGLFESPTGQLYVTLEHHGSLAAAITAVLGVIWSWFLQLDWKTSPKSRVDTGSEG